MNGQFEKGKDDAWYLVISDKNYRKNMGCCRI